jgi:hypothetical protein
MASNDDQNSGIASAPLFSKSRAYAAKIDCVPVPSYLVVALSAG